MAIAAVSLGIIEFYFLHKCLLNSSPHFKSLLSKLSILLNLIGCGGNNSKKAAFQKNIIRLKVKLCIQVYDISDKLSCPFYCHATVAILTKP